MATRPISAVILSDQWAAVVPPPFGLHVERHLDLDLDLPPLDTAGARVRPAEWLLEEVGARSVATVLVAGLDACPVRRT